MGTGLWAQGYGHRAAGPSGHGTRGHMTKGPRDHETRGHGTTGPAIHPKWGCFPNIKPLTGAIGGQMCKAGVKAGLRRCAKAGCKGGVQRRGLGGIKRSGSAGAERVQRRTQGGFPRAMDDRGQQSCRVWLLGAPPVRDTNMITGQWHVQGSTGTRGVHDAH